MSGAASTIPLSPKLKAGLRHGPCTPATESAKTAAGRWVRGGVPLCTAYPCMHAENRTSNPNKGFPSSVGARGVEGLKASARGAAWSVKRRKSGFLQTWVLLAMASCSGVDPAVSLSDRLAKMLTKVSSQLHVIK